MFINKAFQFQTSLVQTLGTLSIAKLTLMTFDMSGSTYGIFRRELEREVIALIPFTCVDTYRGHLEKVRIYSPKNMYYT